MNSSVLINWLNGCHFNKATLKQGDIWYCSKLKHELLITDVRDLEFGIINTVLLSKIDNISDGNDITISLPVSENERLFYSPLKRVALRLTKGPVSVSNLDFYIGALDNNSKEFNQIIASLKNENIEDYIPPQLSIIGDLLDDLNAIRMEAVNVYENNLAEVTVPEESKSKLSEKILNIGGTVINSIEDLLRSVGIIPNDDGPAPVILRGAVQELNFDFEEKLLKLYEDKKSGFSLSLLIKRKKLYYLVLSGKNIAKINKLFLKFNDDVVRLDDENTELEKDKKYFRIPFNYLKKFTNEYSIILKIEK